MPEADKIKAKSIDGIGWVAVNVAAWGNDNHAFGKVRMIADGSALYPRALGVDTDLTARGMGVPSATR